MLKIITRRERRREINREKHVSMIFKKIYKLFEKYQDKIHAWKIKGTKAQKCNFREEVEYRCQVIVYHLRFKVLVYVTHKV